MLMQFKLNYFGLIKIYDKIDLDLKSVFYHATQIGSCANHKIKKKLTLTLRFSFFLIL